MCVRTFVLGGSVVIVGVGPEVSGGRLAASRDVVVDDGAAAHRSELGSGNGNRSGKWKQGDKSTSIFGRSWIWLSGMTV